MNGFTVSAILTRASALSDGGVSVGFHTKELPPEEKIEVMKLFNQTGWLLFSPDSIQESAIPEKKSEFETKTPSQRLRGVLYRVWEQEGKQGEFEDYYKKFMNNIIDRLKEKLD